MSIVPYSISDIVTKVRRITSQTSSNQMSDQQIINYVNTFYIYDFPEHLRLESLKVNYQFVTSANVPVYDFPTNIYLTNNPPVYIGGYLAPFSLSRQNFYSISNGPQYLTTSLYTGNGTVGPYTGQSVSQAPILRGWKANPPGAYSTAACQAQYINWAVVVSGTTSAGVSTTLVDDGQGNLISPTDPATPPSYPVVRGSVNYQTGAISINSTGFLQPIGTGNPINVQCTPIVVSRPLGMCFFGDQFFLWPVPDQAYTVSIEAYEYPIPFNSTASEGQVITSPKLREWWQALAYGAADKIFTDLGDVDSVQKFRPFLQEQLKLINRRTVVQQTSSQTQTIYNQQSYGSGFAYGNWPYLF